MASDGVRSAHKFMASSVSHEVPESLVLSVRHLQTSICLSFVIFWFSFSLETHVQKCLISIPPFQKKSLKKPATSCHNFPPKETHPQKCLVSIPPKNGKHLTTFFRSFLKRKDFVATEMLRSISRSWPWGISKQMKSWPCYLSRWTFL